MVGFPILTSILRTLIFLTCLNYDTPKYYISINKEIKAIKVLEKIYKKNHV